MKTKRVIVFTLINSLLLAGGAWAATDTANLTINATVATTAKLTLGSASINFPDADPDTTPTINAPENPVSVTAKVKTGSSSTATLTVIAGGDLTGAGGTIPISAVKWTAAGNGFVSGTMDKTTPQSAGSWVGSGNRNSSFSYTLDNSWNYAPGSYTAIVTYTLTAP
jgi:hypothetical protein